MDIHNSDTVQELRKAIRSDDFTAKDIVSKAVPVIEINPRLLRSSTIVIRALSANSTGTTLYTTDSRKDFYVTGVTLSYQADASAVTTRIGVSCIINGLTTVLIEHAKLTTTASSASGSISFPFPVKVDRGSALSIIASSATGNFNSSACLIGYYDEVSLA